MTNDSRDLEILVAKIQKQLAPKAEVLHDVRLVGRKSKSNRQIDVLVKEQIGQYPIHIVIDCKDHARPVDVKGVEEFYGLLSDVGAQKGVLVCPKGFTSTAKTRAEELQLDLYSPVDTDPHKWQVSVTIPALCDFRTAAISFGLSFSSPLPFKTMPDFFATEMIYDSDENELGTALDTALEKWNEGRFPIDLGESDYFDLFDVPKVMMNNGYGQIAPVDLTVSLLVKQQLYYGQLPVPHISGFKDELSGLVIANAFEVGILDPNEIEKDWRPINSVEDSPVEPVIRMVGLVGWLSAPRP